MIKKTLIAIEGLDGCGKATQSEELLKALQARGHSARLVSYPVYANNSSMAVRMYLGGEIGSLEDVHAEAASMFYSIDRYIDFMTSWKDDYNRGVIIIADRFTATNMYYQAAKILMAECNYLDKVSAELEAKIVHFGEWVTELEQHWLRLPTPNIEILLSLHPDKAIPLLNARRAAEGERAKGDIHEINEPYLRMVYKTTKILAPARKWSVVHCDGESISPIRTVGDIHREVLRLILPYIAEQED